MLISWVAGSMGCTGFVMIVLLPGDLIQAAATLPLDFLVDKGFAGGWRRILWRSSSSWLKCHQLDLSVFLLLYLVWIRVESVCLVLCSKAESGGLIHCVYCHSSMLCLLLGGRQIMREMRRLWGMGSGYTISRMILGNQENDPFVGLYWGWNEKGIKWFCIALKSKCIFHKWAKEW